MDRRGDWLICAGLEVGTRAGCLRLDADMQGGWTGQSAYELLAIGEAVAHRNAGAVLDSK